MINAAKPTADAAPSKITVIRKVIPRECQKDIYEAVLRMHLEETDQPLYGDTSIIDAATGYVRTVGAFYHVAIRALHKIILRAIEANSSVKGAKIWFDALNVRQQHLCNKATNLRTRKFTESMYRGFINLNYTVDEDRLREVGEHTWPMQELHSGNSAEFVEPGDVAYAPISHQSIDTFMPVQMPTLRLFFVVYWPGTYHKTIASHDAMPRPMYAPDFIEFAKTEEMFYVDDDVKEA